ncbi:MAG: hypothetical protein ACI89L_000231 [Phycisphaerales bacterium]|jgi:hypothetical protein
MSLQLPWHRATRTGIDLGTRWIKAVELNADGSVARCVRFPRGAEALDESEIARLCEILRRQGFTLRTVTLLAAQGSLRRQVVRLPDKPDPTRDDAIVRNQFAELEGEPGEIAWWELPRSRRATDGREALAYEADHATTAALLGGFEAQGVRVRGIDTHSSAFTRAVGRGDCVVADLGWSRLGLMLAVEGLPVYERSDPAGGLESLVRAETERTERTGEQVESLIRNEDSDRGLLGLPGAMGWARTTAESITATADYAVRRYALAETPRVVLTGGGATEEVARALGGLIGLELEVAGGGVEADQFAALAAARRWAA